MSSESMASSETGAARRPLLGKVYGWLATVDHKRLGILYILFALDTRLCPARRPTLVQNEWRPLRPLAVGGRHCK